MLELLNALLKALQEKLAKGEMDAKTIKIMAQIRATSLEVEKDIKAQRKARKELGIEIDETV